MPKNWPLSFFILSYGQQPDLKLAFTRVKILAPCHASFQDEARCHEMTSLSVTMEVVIATSNYAENFFAFALRTFCSTVQR